MGFFDRLSGKKPAASAAPAASPTTAATAAVPVQAGASDAAESVSATAAPLVGGGVMPRLAVARQKLEARDLPGAIAIYEEVLAAAGDRADVLVTISGDLGSSGHLAPIVELVAPRYDAQRHGPATGLNLLQAYLALRQAGAAQHVLDILFALNRPELEERLYGFSNAIADLMAAPSGTAPESLSGEAPPEAAKVAIVTISKPIWSYGLEAMAGELLPPKGERLRRVAFAQLALPGAYRDAAAASKKPEDELGRLSRGLPLWLAEKFYFCPHYAPVAAAGLLDDPTDGKSYVVFSSEWTTTNLQQLVDSTTGGLDYIFTGALQQTAGDYELLLRVFEVKKFRERKTFTARWTPATADTELAKLLEQIGQFMEWTPAQSGLAYVPTSEPGGWIDTLGASLSLFLADKSLLPMAQLAPLAPVLERTAPQVMIRPIASLAWLTLQARANRLGLKVSWPSVQYSSHPVVAQARQVAGI
jgi:hypothetical protein